LPLIFVVVQHLLFVSHALCAEGTAAARRLLLSKGSDMANEFARIDRVLDEVLVQLGEMVLTLAGPRVTKTSEERQALARSVSQYAICAANSDDPRVKELKARLEDSLKPKLQLVISK
jgi:hypothetical protein